MTAGTVRDGVDVSGLDRSRCECHHVRRGSPGFAPNVHPFRNWLELSLRDWIAMRLIITQSSVTGFGAGDSRGRGGPLYNAALCMILRRIYADKDAQE